MAGIHFVNNMYVPYKTGYVNVDDIHRVYFACYGCEGGKPVFIFHGGPGYGFSDDLIDCFDFRKWNIIAIDQRGCGQSLPKGCIENNNTDFLVEDIKRIADYLGIGRFTVRGESWGSTLALVFAERYPSYISSMILTGVFLGDNSETLLGKNGGFEKFYPEYWKHYIELLPVNKRKKPYESYYNYLLFGTESEKEKYGRELVFLEILTETAVLDERRANRICDNLDCKNIAKIEAYYTINDFFIKNNYILDNIDRIVTIPISIVHGRHDLIVPVINAWKLSQRLQNCDLIIPELSGHSSDSMSTTLNDVISRHLQYQ